MDVPEDLKYTKDHEWIRVTDTNTKKGMVGITDFAQKELGDIVYVEIETEGEELQVEESFGTIEAVKTVSDLFMPLSGTILKVNPALEGTPEMVNQDPYGEGWMVEVEINDLADVDGLLSPEEYQNLIEE